AGQGAAEVVRLHNERVTLPAANGVAVPVRLRLTLLGKLTPVGVDGSEAVIRFVHDDYLSWQLNDLARLRVEVIFERPLRQAQRVWIVERARSPLPQVHRQRTIRKPP